MQKLARILHVINNLPFKQTLIDKRIRKKKYLFSAVSCPFNQKTEICGWGKGRDNKDLQFL